MTDKATNQLSKLSQKINRAHMKKNRIVAQQKNTQTTSRKMRTRTLIQLGGLLEKANLLAPFDIQTGEDLQHTEHLHKAVQLLGLLKTVESENTFSDTQLAHYQTLGEAKLKTDR